MSTSVRPRILLLDLETFPNVAYVWGAWEQNAIEMRDDWYILSAAWQWYGTRPVFAKGLCDYRGYTGGASTERALLKDLHSLMDEADIIVAHNGVDFDVKVANTRFIAHGFDPPSPYKVVDTKRTIKQVARFSSNKLDWLCRQLGLGRKVETEGFPLWKGCAAGDKAAWRKMLRYNKHDVRLLADLYRTISPWIKQPNMALFTDGEHCVNPACGANSLVKRGIYRAVTRSYQRYYCPKCGKWARTVIAERRPRAVVTGAL